MNDSVLQGQGHRTDMESGARQTVGPRCSGKRPSQTVHDRQGEVAQGSADFAWK